MISTRFFQTAIVIVGAAAVFVNAQAAEDITGAGSTFAYPIFAKWAETYKQSTKIGLNYQSIGSGGGIKQIKAGTVDFGASDKPLQPEELNESGLAQFPAIMGGVVPVVNLEGVKGGQLKLTGDVLAKIYLGKIAQWNAPEIASLNPGIKLPSDDITVVHRADGSGTTFLFTNYLSKVNAEFKNTVGADAAVKWPAGVGGKGNEGVAANVERIKGSVGYVEYAYAKKNNMTYTQLKSHDGQFVLPQDDSFRAAASGADWAHTPAFAVILTDQAGKASWPITGATFVLVRKTQENLAKGMDVLKFFDWAYKNGGAMATELDYVAMPPAVTKLIEASWTGIKDSKGKAIWK